VTAVGDAGALDVNDAPIRIAAATIEVITPTARTTAAFGAPVTIAFKHNVAARTRIAIDVSGDDGATWRTALDTRTKGSTTSSFTWVADVLPTARARVRVRALDGSGALTVSPAFRVTAAKAP
jgi:hypothetical protein